MAEDVSASANYTERKPKWANKWEFLASCVSMSVGLGNFWRFPYVAYNSGGGAFLIPYIVVLTLIGRPMYYLDLAMGQFSGRGSVGMYKCLAPAWIGVGISQAITCYNVTTYYAFLLSIVTYYLINSFTTTLPWTICQNEWGNNCVAHNYSGFENNTDIMSSAEFYLEKQVLHKASSIDNGIGWPSWVLCLCLLAVYFVCFLYILFGIRSAGKLAYFTAIFPYVVIIVLLIKSSTLKGAGDGILFFIKPNWRKLLDPTVWLSAITQCFFSLGISFGTIAMYSSYSDFKENVNLIALLVSIIDTFTSLLSAFTIFGALGNLANRMNIKVQDVIRGGGMYLAFVSYTDAISKFESIPYVFSVVFFFMFFTLGIGSLAGFMQGVTTNLLELIPKLKEWHASAIICVAGFLVSIIYTTPGGYALFYLMDLYGTVYVLLVLAIVQLLSISYVYKLRYFCWDLEFMTKSRLNQYWRLTWAVIGIILMVLTCIYSFILDGIPKYNDKPLPLYAIIGSFVLLFITSSPVFIGIIYEVVKSKKKGLKCKEARHDAFRSDDWLPLDKSVQAELKEFREMKKETYRYKDRSPFVQYLMSLIKKD